MRRTLAALPPKFLFIIQNPAPRCFFFFFLLLQHSPVTHCYVSDFFFSLKSVIKCCFAPLCVAALVRDGCSQVAGDDGQKPQSLFKRNNITNPAGGSIMCKGNRKGNRVVRKTKQKKKKQSRAASELKCTPDVPPGSRWTMKYALNTHRIILYENT